MGREGRKAVGRCSVVELGNRYGHWIWGTGGRENLLAVYLNFWHAWPVGCQRVPARLGVLNKAISQGSEARRARSVGCTGDGKGEQGRLPQVFFSFSF